MKPTDTSEKNLESYIIASLVEEGEYVPGDPGDYDRLKSNRLENL